MKNLLAVCSVAAAAVLAFSASGAGPAAAQGATVRVALHNIPPFGGAEPSGLCFDVLEAIAERQGVELQYQTMAIGDIVPALAAGNVDLGCSGNGPSGSLSRGNFSFTSAFASNREILLVRSSDTSTYAALSDLGGLRVGTVGPYMHLVTTAGLTNLVTLAGFPDGLAALRAGDIDVYLTAETIW